MAKKADSTTDNLAKPVADTPIGIPAPDSGISRTLAGSADRPLEIGGTQIDCYVLEDETRVLSQRGMFKGLGVTRGGPRTKSEPSNTGAEIPRFASQKWLKPFIDSDLEAALKSPFFFPASYRTYGLWLSCRSLGRCL